MPAAQQVTRTVDVPAEPERVWERSLGDGGALSSWLGGEVELDIRPGGTGTLREPGGAAKRLVVEEVTHGERLAFHWWPAEAEGRTPADAGATSVDIRLVPVPDGTRVTVTETAAHAATASVTTVWAAPAGPLAGAAPVGDPARTTAAGPLLVAGGVPVRA